MNKVIITGRWTKDPDVRYTQGDEPMAIAKGSIAVDRKGKDKGADFPSVVAFGKIAEHIGKYYHKGMKTNIVGHLQTGSYEHKDGYKVYTTDVFIDEIEFGESKNDEIPKTQAQKEEAAVSTEFMTVPDDAELPFN